MLNFKIYVSYIQTFSTTVSISMILIFRNQVFFLVILLKVFIRRDYPKM